jgi:hypothetical protein
MFDYEPWDKSKDKLLHRPGNTLGFTAILNGLDVGDMSSIRKRARDTLIRETEQGVIELIAGGLEWIRSRGYSAEAIQSKVGVFIKENQNTARQTLVRAQPVLNAIEQISNPRRRRLSDKVVIG